MPNSLVRSYAKKSGRPIKQVELLWKKFKAILLSNGHKSSDSNFYALLVGMLRKNLKIKKESNDSIVSEILESLNEQEKWKIRSEPKNSASIIFKRDAFNKRREKMDKELEAKRKKAKSEKDEK